MTDVVVRAVHGAAAVPELSAPHDTVHYRIFHPAVRSHDDRERLTGEVPPERSRAPWPVVVLLPGINTGPEGYRWLATELAGRGYAVVLYALVGETLPGAIGITPGLDLSAVRPDVYGSRPTCPAIAPILEALAAEHAAGPLAGLLDLSKVVLGGHSAGGTVALQNCSPDWFEGLAAVWTYGAHTMASTMLGWPEAHVLPAGGDVPTLLVGGELDGVISASADRYAVEPGASDHDPITRTFHEALAGDRGDCYLAIVSGAVHTSILEPEDPSTGRGFLDLPASREPAAIRADLASLIAGFLDAHVRVLDGAADDLRAFLDDRRSITRSARR